MFRLRSMLIVAVFLTASCTRETAQEPAYYDSLRLVSAMREDELMLLAVRSAKSSANALSEEDAACLDRFEFPEVTDIAARRISDKMTAAEVEDALGYFHSPGGRKVVRRAELALTGKLADAPELSATEQAELEQFKQRPAGRKLLRDRITTEVAQMEEATARVDRQLEDCAYVRQLAVARQAPQKSCKSKPIASLDHVCLASYAAEGAGSTRKAWIEVDCRHHGKSLTSKAELAQPQWPIALRWSKSRELEILIKNNRMKIVSSDDGYSAQRFRFASWQPGDPPPVDCLPVSSDRSTLAEHLPLSTAIGAWRAHRRPGVCLMTARVAKEQVSGAEKDKLLQFRRHKTATLPFATTDLAFVVQIDQSQDERPLLVDSSGGRLAMIEHGWQTTHMLTGKAAEALLQNLASTPGELTVQPEGAPSYAIAIGRQDFDFAYADFSECLAGLKAT